MLWESVMGKNNEDSNCVSERYAQGYWLQPFIIKFLTGSYLSGVKQAYTVAQN